MTKSTGKAPAASKAKAARSGAKRSSRHGQSVTVGFVNSGPMPRTGFLAKTKLKKSGGSLIATVPAPAARLLHLSEGQEMAVTVEGSKVIMEPMPTAKPMRVRRPKYTLEELLTGSNPDAPMSDEERAWHDAPPAGREIW